ncbi:Protein-serine/threonine phosphatase protein [Dioscorea alata]|uniref:Protein-serine/threonine phosphatase protein n=1 Tax=Dioscorea alata TaxID=55571 RepID=A0ACB7VGL6_DIOAL|nr:Protein-serine/threonine phosphatase protein [Dioscorea alata]
MDSKSYVEPLEIKEVKLKEIDKSLECIVQQIHQDTPDSELQVMIHVKDSISGKETSVGKKRWIAKSKVNKELQESHMHGNGKLLVEIDNVPDISVVSPKENLETLSSDCLEKLKLPPPPVRKIASDHVTLNIPINKNNPRFSLYEEEGCFSFQTVSNVLEDKPSDTSDVRGDEEIIVWRKRGNSFSSMRNRGVDHASSLGLMNQDKKLETMIMQPERAVISLPRQKLLVLDLNGLLADILSDPHKAHKADIRIRGKSLFKRPFCDDFLKFCFERFNIGVWSSRVRYNVDSVVDFLMGDLKQKLLFCWDLSKCTTTGFRTIENVHKPLVLKDLKKLWNKEEPDLQWEIGEYTSSNTLLIDDSPYKALCNPPHTSIFPHPYNFYNRHDNSLGPGGDLRVYLEGLAMCDDTQQYVREHPFGQAAISEKHPDWKFYRQIIKKIPNYSSLT